MYGFVPDLLKVFFLRFGMDYISNINMTVKKLWSSMLLLLTLVLCTTIVFSSCGSDDEDYTEDTDSSTYNDPVYTGKSSNISYNSASVSASFYLCYWDYLEDEYYKPSKIGIILSKTNGWFDIESADKVKSFTFNKQDKTIFSKEGVFTGLDSDCTYYAKAFVVCANNVEEYGDVISFRTLEDPAYPHYDYVDLGISVKWATCNVGASAPEESGNFYSFGESETKNEYSIDNYSHHSTSSYKDQYGNSILKYSFTESSFDICKQLWGNSWRLPTHKEIKELSEKCQWRWTSLNGVNGYEVKGSNGNSIFLPAAGYYDDEELEQVGIEGCYLSSTYPLNINPLYGWFNALSFDKESRNTGTRCCWDGYTVRAVKE